MGDVDARVHIFAATALGRGRMAMLGFYIRLNGPQGHSGHEGAKKISTLRLEPIAHSQAPCGLSHLVLFR